MINFNNPIESFRRLNHLIYSLFFSYQNYFFFMILIFKKYSQPYSINYVEGFAWFIVFVFPSGY